MIDYAGTIYGQEDIEKSCDLLENLFGSIFFKKEMERIKDSDPCGAGMGREYCGVASRLFLAWHRAKEELIFGGLDEKYRPGRYGALIGSLGEDLQALREVPGIAGKAAGLLNDHTFEETVYLLFIASRIHVSRKGLIFKDSHRNYFHDCNYQYACLSPGAITPQELPAVIQSASASTSGSKTISLVYVDLSQSELPLANFKEILSANNLGSGQSLYPAVALTKTEFPSGIPGYYRRVACLPLIDQKTSGLAEAEGLINLNLPL